MKTPKLLAAVPILALSTSAFIGWSAITRASQTDTAASANKAKATFEAKDPVVEARIARMDSEINHIASRLGVSAPMEDHPLIDSEQIQMKIADGTIVDVTVEQVEAAIAAAAMTPGTGDDIDALILKHRGTYRFFAPE